MRPNMLSQQCNMGAFWQTTAVKLMVCNGNICPIGPEIAIDGPSMVGAGCRWGTAHGFNGAIMGEWIETTAVSEIFVTEIAQIELIGGIARLILTVPQSLGGGDLHNVVVARLLVPIASLSGAISQLVAVQASGKH